MSTGDLDAMQKQYRDQLNALDYDDMLLNRGGEGSSSLSSTNVHSSPQLQQQATPLRNKFSTPPPIARSNSTPPGPNNRGGYSSESELMMMNQFGTFGLNSNNEEVKKSVCLACVYIC